MDQPNKPVQQSPVRDMPKSLQEMLKSGYPLLRFVCLVALLVTGFTALIAGISWLIEMKNFGDGTFRMRMLQCVGLLLTAAALAFGLLAVTLRRD